MQRRVVARVDDDVRVLALATTYVCRRRIFHWQYVRVNAVSRAKHTNSRVHEKRLHVQHGL